MRISKKQMVVLTKRIDINQDDNDILLTNALNRYKNNSVLLEILMTFCFPKSLPDTESLHKSMLITDMNIFFFQFLLFFVFYIYILFELRETRGSNFKSNSNDISRLLKGQRCCDISKETNVSVFQLFFFTDGKGWGIARTIESHFFLVKWKS